MSYIQVPYEDTLEEGDTEMLLKKEIGKNVWVGGSIFEIVGWDKANIYCMKLDKNRQPFPYDNVVQAFPHSSAEEIAEDCFKIGDVVETTYRGTFRGTVVGFEINDNRVVCKSDKTSFKEDTRLRYAYKPHEIQLASSDETHLLVDGVSITIKNGSVLIKGVKVC